MGQKADVQFERLLEYFEEIMADLSLQIWFDRGVDLTPNGDTTLSPQGVPRFVTSRSLDLQYGGFRSFISTKKEVKIESLERAIDELKYESEPSSNNDTKRLREFLESINDFEWQLLISESTICFYGTEDVMASLNSYKLTLYKWTDRNNSFLKRRRKLIAKIDEQILIATDSNYGPTRIKWVHNEDSTECELEIPKRIGRWWCEQQGGTILLTIRYGNKVIELEQGKNAIELSSTAELEPTLQSIKKAVDDGKFDTLLEEQLEYGSRITKK